MIYIATVHWQTDKWIDLQLSYIERFLTSPVKVYSFLNGIDRCHYSKFSFVCDEPIEDHGIKLNLLANFISLEASDNDLLIFLDGDAFPIVNIEDFLKQTLEQYPITAILRSESLADKQPHPSFLATTIGFWKKIEGDWKKGYCWQDSLGNLISDIGGNLLGKIEKDSIPWLPLYRTHSLTEHPLWYGIYHKIIYHHGAGFRDPLSRVDATKLPIWLKWLELSISKSRSLNVILHRMWEKILMKSIGKTQVPVHEEIYDNILKNENFFSNQSIK